MFSRARWRLTLWFAGALVVILGVIGVAVYLSAQRSLFSQVNSDLEARAQRELLRPLTQQILQEVRRGVPPGRVHIGPEFTAGGYFYSLVDDGGALIASTQNVDPAGLAPASEVQHAIEKGPSFDDTQSSEGENLRVYLLPVTAGRGVNLVLEVGRSTEPERQALRRLVFILAAGGAMGLVLALAGGFLLAGRTLRPIKTVMDRQRGFVADASHELRTPLALIRANAEILKRAPEKPVAASEASVDDIIAETDRLNHLVGQMLTLARAESEGPPVEASPVDLAAMSAVAVREMRLLAAPKRITIQEQTDGPAVVRGDETRLSELVAILLDNAIKYSDEGGQVRLAVSRSGDQVTLSVADNGRGIAAEALPHVFERFYRADKARSREMGGTGLGLSIAKWIVESHKGSIGIESKVGLGTTVTVRLPADGATGAAS